MVNNCSLYVYEIVPLMIQAWNLELQLEYVMRKIFGYRAIHCIKFAFTKMLIMQWPASHIVRDIV